ncbi:flagellar biosynthetic protein FliR [Candidatus Latescibacterota bacterium]
MEYWLSQFHIFILILLRVSALVMVAPIFGHRNYLGRAKIGLAFMLSMIVFPLLAETGLVVPEGLFPYVFMMVREVIMGLVMGFAVLLLFVGIQFAGQLIGLQMGFGIVNVIDPQSSNQISIIGQFLNILAILTMLSLNGHHMILRGLMGSFQTVPLGGVTLKVPIVGKVVALSSQVFVIAIKISAPILIALFLVSVALGILARTVPQMNVFIVGFPVQIGVGLAVLMMTLPLFYVMLQRLTNSLERDLFVLVDFFH